MSFFNIFKEKIIEPNIHENEQGLTLVDGAHILNNCNRVKLDGTAVVLESHNTNYDSVKGHSKIQILNGGKISDVSGKTKLGYLKDVYIATIRGNAEVTTINSAIIDYVKDRVVIRTMNNGVIKFLDNKARLDTMNNGKIMFVRNRCFIGTMCNGNIDGIMDNAQISTVQNGKINYVLDKAYIGTINHCSISEVCDNTEIGTFADGEIGIIVGNSIVCQQMGGKVSTKQDGPIIVYTNKRNQGRIKKRIEKETNIANNKEIDIDFKENVKFGEQTSILDLENKEWILFLKLYYTH